MRRHWLEMLVQQVWAQWPLVLQRVLVALMEAVPRTAPVQMHKTRQSQQVRVRTRRIE
jgi:hypothetical protein